MHLSRAKWTIGGRRGHSGSWGCAHTGRPPLLLCTVPGRVCKDAHPQTATHTPQGPCRPPGQNPICACGDSGSPQGTRNMTSPIPQTLVQICSKELQVSTQIPEHTAVTEPHVSQRGCPPATQKPCSSGMCRYKSRVSGFEKDPRCSTAFPAMTCFTATSTFLPLRVYCQENTQKRHLNPKRGRRQSGLVPRPSPSGKTDLDPRPQALSPESRRTEGQAFGQGERTGFPPLRLGAHTET